MTAETGREQALVAEYIHEEGQRALARGARYLAIFGLVSAVQVEALLALGYVAGVRTASVFALLGGTWAWLTHRMARRGALKGALAYVFLLPLTSLPTGFFLASHFALPGGVATWLTGPFSYLYAPLIILTGFLFQRALPVVAGAVAAAGYLVCTWLAVPTLVQVVAPDPILQQELSSPAIYVLKTMMLLLTGLVVGSLAHYGRKLILRVLHEENEKKGISRLFGQFVSHEVRDKIIREKSTVLGERKTVVVLFSDVRAFSSWSEGADPAAVVQQLNQYFDGMVGAIQRHGGIIDKFIGDAVMAVFGGVLELENPSENALRAAREMRAVLRTLNARWAAAGMPQLDNGIGLHRGEVLQGTVGSADRKEFTVIGDAVNTASRLESATKDFQQSILISQALHDALTSSSQAHCRHLGQARLKGKAQEVTVYGVAD
ncbi:MAG: adenylate/guanylate cyclase domain-containing protein [Myxococcota bacterium]